MDAKERLWNYQSHKQEYVWLQRQLEDIEDMLLYFKLRCPKYGKPQERLTVHTRKLQKFYRAKLAELAAEQLAVEEAIGRLAPSQRTLMRCRYMDGLKWEEVCDRMNYSWTQIHRIHADTLAALESVLSAKGNEKPGGSCQLPPGA